MALGKDMGKDTHGISGKPATVLIVDDELVGRMAARKLIVGNSYIDEPVELAEASTIPEALGLLAQLPIEVVLLDKNVGPDPSNLAQNGIESIPEMLRLRPSLRVLLLTASSKSEDITRAIKLGAFDYMVKTSPKEARQKKVALAIDEARIAFRKLAIARLDDPFPKEDQSFLGGSSRPWMKIMSRAKLFAPNRLEVLITGDTGTGKTEVAKKIHYESQQANPNKAKAFVDLNMAAIPAELAERELFGNERGAFTGADERRSGLFEFANNGTLFLDEIGETSLTIQGKLLKVIAEKKFRRLGGKELFHSDFKLICATNRDLKKMVAEGSFREDLYMRISTLIISVPPFSERRSDISEIVEGMLPDISARANVPISFKEIPKDFIDYLTEKEFPGNARGIAQQVARFLVMAPPDPDGKKVFSNWQRFMELDEAEIPKSTDRSPLTLDELLQAPLHIFGSEFPGLKKTVSRFRDRIYLEARRHYRSNNAVARALKVSSGTASTNLTRIESHQPSKV